MKKTRAKMIILGLVASIFAFGIAMYLSPHLRVWVCQTVHLCMQAYVPMTEEDKRLQKEIEEKHGVSF